MDVYEACQRTLTGLHPALAGEALCRAVDAVAGAPQFNAFQRALARMELLGLVPAMWHNGLVLSDRLIDAYIALVATGVDRHAAAQTLARMLYANR